MAEAEVAETVFGVVVVEPGTHRPEGMAAAGARVGRAVALGCCGSGELVVTVVAATLAGLPPVAGEVVRHRSVPAGGPGHGGSSRTCESPAAVRLRAVLGALLYRDGEVCVTGMSSCGAASACLQHGVYLVGVVEGGFGADVAGDGLAVAFHLVGVAVEDGGDDLPGAEERDGERVGDGPGTEVTQRAAHGRSRISALRMVRTV